MAVKLQVVMTIPGKEPREFEYEFDQARISIGRDQTNDIQVPLSTVSRAHCVLFEENREWYLEDLKSTHGTKHNGKPVGPGGKKLLRDRDLIELVHFKITFSNPKGVSADYSVEKTEALARKMVEEVLASIGKQGSDVPYLRVMNGPEEGKRFEVGANVVEATIGRGADCDFQVNDANISRRHAIVRRDWNEITIEDAGSKNGVLINDRRIAKPTPLRDADEILLGAARLTFIDPSAKYIGKLDDLPGFAPDEPEEESESETGGELDGEASAELPVPDQASDGPALQAAADPAPVAGPGPELVPPRIADEPEPDAFDSPPPKKAGVGPWEVVWVLAAIAAVAGIVLVVALLLFEDQARPPPAP